MSSNAPLENPRIKQALEALHDTISSEIEQGNAPFCSTIVMVRTSHSCAVSSAGCNCAECERTFKEIVSRAMGDRRAAETQETMH